MGSPAIPTLTEEQIDDLLYYARTNDLAELTEIVNSIADSLNVAPHVVISSAIDSNSGNSILHMASANGHIGEHSTLESLNTRIDIYSATNI